LRGERVELRRWTQFARRLRLAISDHAHGFDAGDRGPSAFLRRDNKRPICPCGVIERRYIDSMRLRFCIWIVSPPDYLHSHAFDEVASALQASFAELGMVAPIVRDQAEIEDWALVLGPPLLMFVPEPPTRKLILFNMEQIGEGGGPLPGYVDLLRGYRVWDYSARNVEMLAGRFGVTNVTLCGVGYMPLLTRIEPAEEDIDVLLVGHVNERRNKVIVELQDRGLIVRAVYDKYGVERDRAIARAKIQINIHFYDARVFEIVRVSYLLANRRCLVSESGLDETLEAPLRPGVAFASYEDLVPTCLRLLDDAEERARLGRKGFEVFSAMSQTAMLSRALRATFPEELGGGS
jgi:hypothetical protein